MTMGSKYEVGAQLGAGATGVVYAVRHRTLHKEFAFKVIRPELAARKDLVARFFAEARAAASIRHPGIVDVYDVGFLPDGRAFILMELVRGETLSARIAKAPGRRLTESKAILLVRHLADAVGAAHRQGVVHRDLKPDNVFVVPDAAVLGGERIKVVDFGIAKLHEPVVGTRMGSVFGSPPYMAPEQWKDASFVDARTDIYAIGCIFHEMMSGQPPFGWGGLELERPHRNNPPPSLEQVGASMQVAQLVQTLLAKSFEDRPSSCAQLVQKLDVLPSRPSSGPRASAPTDETVLPPPPPGSDMASRPDDVTVLPEDLVAFSSGAIPATPTAPTLNPESNTTHAYDGQPTHVLTRRKPFDKRIIVGAAAAVGVGAIILAVALQSESNATTSGPTEPERGPEDPGPRPDPDPSLGPNPNPGPSTDYESEVQDFVRGWARAFSTDADRFAEYYAEPFEGVRCVKGKLVGFEGVAAWMNDRQPVIRSERPHVDVLDLQIKLHGDEASATFQQRYLMAKYSDVGKKILTVSRDGGQWKIHREQMLSCSSLGAMKLDASSWPASRLTAQFTFDRLAGLVSFQVSGGGYNELIDINSKPVSGCTGDGADARYGDWQVLRSVSCNRLDDFGTVLPGESVQYSVVRPYTDLLSIVARHFRATGPDQPEFRYSVRIPDGAILE